MTLSPAPLLEKTQKPDTPFSKIIDVIEASSLEQDRFPIMLNDQSTHEGRMSAFTAWHEAFVASSPEGQSLLDNLSTSGPAIEDWFIKFCTHSSDLHERISANPTENIPGLNTQIQDFLLKIEQETLTQLIPTLDQINPDQDGIINHYVDATGATFKTWIMLQGMSEYGNPQDLLRRFNGELLATLPYALDQVHFAQNLPDTHPDTPESNFTIQFEYLARGFFDQYANELNPEAAEECLQSFLEHISGHVYEKPVYTNPETAAQVLTEVLKQENPTGETLVIGVGAGTGPDVASLKNSGITQFDAIDILPQPNLPEGISFTQSDLIKYEPAKLFKNILCAGSVLLNQESLAKQLTYWLRVAKLLAQGGRYYYEVGVLDPNQEKNYLFEMARVFNRQDAMKMYGDIGRREAYRQPDETDQTFGAHIFPDFVTKLLGKLVGLKCQKAVTYQTTEDAYRAVYVFEKNGDPHPFTQILLTAASLSADRLRGAKAIAE